MSENHFLAFPGYGDESAVAAENKAIFWADALDSMHLGTGTRVDLLSCQLAFFVESER
jgi:hypothetical protein